jgi:GT2 family glycosyltransferase
MLSIIIVNYNTRDTTLQCLRTLSERLREMGNNDVNLESAAYDDEYEIIVVDNASQDGSVSAIRKEFPRVQILENAVNVGFGTANNQAMQEAKGEFFLLLNSDAFPQPGAIETLMEYSRDHSNIAVVGPRLLNPDGSVQMSWFLPPCPTLYWVDTLRLLKVYNRIQDAIRHRLYSSATHYDRLCVCGACLLVKRAAYEKIGGFDEEFFMYFEETDWQQRMWRHGWNVAFVAEAKVIHLGGASAHTRSNRSGQFFAGRDRYIRKHHGIVGFISMRLAQITACSINLTVASFRLVMPKRRSVAFQQVKSDWNLMMQYAKHWRSTIY